MKFQFVLIFILQILQINGRNLKTNNNNNQLRKLQAVKEHTQLLLTMTLNDFDCDTYEITKSIIEQTWGQFFQCATCATFFSLDACQPQPQILVRIIDNDRQPKQLQQLINTIYFASDCINNQFKQFGEIDLKIQSHTPIIDSKLQVHNLSDSEVVQNSKIDGFYSLLPSCNLQLQDDVQQDENFEQIEQLFVQSLKNSFWNPDQRDLKSQVQPQYNQSNDSKFVNSSNTEIQKMNVTKQQNYQFSNDIFKIKVQIEPLLEKEGNQVQQSINDEILVKKPRNLVPEKSPQEIVTTNSQHDDDDGYYNNNNNEIILPSSSTLQNPGATHQQFQDYDENNNKFNTKKILLWRKKKSQQGRSR
eukprot:TRINITY_DN28344_c0_g1_i1.p1 TRINITY_DN28344_c0_g1~~TRINITY_DN28344_c0_g1_i1.p1  ORF type:complete len:360 (+),score=23.90 TRINITY_DN28344_c0_g1_i1:131-1210(+)